MKLDSSSSASSSSTLTGYLVTNLRPLTPADPAILAEYVVALLKKNKPTEELQKLCVESLKDFLGKSTNSFINNLFLALEDGSIVRSVDTIDGINKSEPSAYPAGMDPLEQRELPSNDERDSPSKKEQELSTLSGTGSEPDDQEVSDDDDRNHKHRKRDPQPVAFDRNDQMQFIGRSKGRRNKNFENGGLFQEGYSYLNENKREHNPLLGKDTSLKLEKRCLGMPLPELGQRNQINQSFWTESASRFDSSVSIIRPPGGRGRGRGTGSRTQHDSRFVTFGAVDFASHVASQGPSHPNMFLGSNLPSAANAQNTSWGAFGFVPGMPGLCLDPLHPLGLGGTLHSSVSIPRQRCRDFEEQGFCLRGDMCPMEHGVNRIVVEDVQSLSQFNLPVSLPNTHTPGLQAGVGPVNPVMNSKSLPSLSSKAGASDAGESNDVWHSSNPGLESDVYDPDQPLWNNDHSEASKGILRLPPKLDGTGISSNANPCGNHGFKHPDGIENDGPPSKSRTININPQLKRRIGPAVKSKLSNKTENIDDETKEDNDDNITGTQGALNLRKGSSVEEIASKVGETSSTQKFHNDSRQNSARTSQQKLRTLYVSKIPQNSNKKSALLSHFEKFGKVVNIYIPLRGEKAFVQFSKREEAEAALKAPDAVMGNRFIKLFWANRDNIVDEKEVTPDTTSFIMPKPTAPLKLSNSGGKESISSATPKSTNRAVDHATSSAMQPKTPTVCTNKTMLAQKKLETLELMKEELRKKQESLANMRTSFRNQLDKMEKEAISSKKVEPVLEQQPFKKQKLKKDVDVPSTGSAKLVECTTGQDIDYEKKTDKSISGDGDTKQVPKGELQANNFSLPSVNRFKPDNWSTAFRIIPPLPADFSNVVAIKEHFSKFSDLSTVELEDPEDKSGAELKLSSNSSACITFTTRDSAEKAFMGGRCWQGHDLNFEWLKASSNINQHNAQKFSSRSTHEEVEVFVVPPESAVSKSSLSNSGVVDTQSDGVEVVSKEVDVTGDDDQMDVGVDSLHKSSSGALPNTAVMSQRTPISDVAVEDDSHGCAQ